MRNKTSVAGFLVVAIAAAAVLVVTMRYGDSEEAADDRRPTTERRPAVTTAEPSPSASLTDLVGASGLGDPAIVEIPAPEGDSKAWLTGEGAAAVEIVSAAQPLWERGSEACEPATVALDAIGTPEAVTAAAAGTPDGPTREILLGLEIAVETALRACGEPGSFEDARAELAWQWALADRRLDEVGVDR